MGALKLLILICRWPANLGWNAEAAALGGNHTLVFTFSNTVTSGNASVTTGLGNVSGNPSFSGNTMTLNLTGVSNRQKITVNLSGVTDTLSRVLPNTSVSVDMLPGDTTGNRIVNSLDVSWVNTQSGAPVTSTNFRNDVTVDGLINSSDISLVKSPSGTGIP